MNQHAGVGEEVLDGDDGLQHVLHDSELPLGSGQGVIRGRMMWARRGRNQ